MKLNYGNADIVINWAGGLHHAKKAEVCMQPPFKVYYQLLFTPPRNP